MATLIANAATTQNFTGAATFAAAEAGALANVLNRFTIALMAAATTSTSSTFTVTNGKVIDAVLLWVKATAASPTGTFKVDLQKGGVSQASVTVNKADLPDSTNGASTVTVPVLFKLTSTATGDGGANWTIVLTTTGLIGVTVSLASATTTNFTRALRTTTAATIAAADDFYIVGELTGAGTHTSRTVTMDSTAATAYGSGAVNSTTVNGGGGHVGCYGTLTYGNSAATNYVLRINGDLRVYQFGTFNQGVAAAEIPRDGTAILEFQQTSAEGDFGLSFFDNAVGGGAGLSRTVGKNVVQTKLTADTTTNLLASLAGVSTNVTPATLTTTLDPTGTSNLTTGIIGLTDTVTNGLHAASSVALGSVTNTTQVFSVWIAAGSGTNKRFVRMALGSTAGSTSPPTNGFYADIDLQAGTIGSCTANGNGTATSSSIVAIGAGFLCTIIGKASSGALSPIASINICSAAGTTSFAGANNQAIIYSTPAVYTLSARPTDLSINDDTGWLTNDVVAIASTSRTSTESELGILASGAGVGTLTLKGYTSAPSSFHSGTSPTQAEVTLLTRNVKIRSTSTTLHSYVYIAALATVTYSWTEFYQVGANVTGKRGLEIDAGTATNAKSITFCSIHDTHFSGVVLANASSTSLNTTFSNNNLWFSPITSGNGVVVNAVITNTDWTIDNVVAIRSGGTASFNIVDVGGTFTNSTAAGGTGIGFVMNETAVAFGTFSNLTAHSNTGLGTSLGTPTGTITNPVNWRNGGVGISITVAAIDLILAGGSAFGNTTTNILLAANATHSIKFTGSWRMSADTTFAVTENIKMNGSGSIQLYLDSVDTSVTGIYAAATNDVTFPTAASSPVSGFIIARNPKFGGTNLINTSGKTSWVKDFYFGMEKYGQTSGDHRMEVTYGSWKTDSVIYNTASPSQRITPSDATNKCESGTRPHGILAAVATGGIANISVYVRKSAVGDGTAYNGNQPRLVQRSNPALGASADVVLDTVTVAVGNWEQLTGTSSVATDDGAFEFVVDLDGTTGWVNVDDWAVS